MKKILCCLLAFALALPLLCGTALAEENAELTVIDAAETEPENYQAITGFDITYTLVKGGHMGSDEEPFPVNGVMIAKGACTIDDFGWEEGASLPKFQGPAEEIISHVTGDGSFVGTMFFKNGVDAGALAEGETGTIHFEGDAPLFDGSNSCLTAYPMFGTEVEIGEVTWIMGEINENSQANFTWDSVETVEYLDIPTVENGGDNNYVNITVPKDGGPYPVVLWVHGGGWTQLDRYSCFIEDTIDYLLSKGFAVVSAEYKLNDLKDNAVTSYYPQMIYDLKAAVRFLRANGEQYNLDTSFIAAMGESAGAHLSMLMGTTNGNPEYEDLAMGNADYSSDVQAMISYFGPTDAWGDQIMGQTILAENFSEAAAKAVSPYYTLTENAPPLFLTHGLNDQTVSVEHSQKMEKKAKQVLGEENVTAIFYENAPHANIAAFDSPEAMQAVAMFLTDTLAKFKSTMPAEADQNDSAAASEVNMENAPQSESKDIPSRSSMVPMVLIVAIIIIVVAAGVILLRKKNGQKK